MVKKKKSNKFLYFVSCIILYSIIPFVVLLIPISNIENKAMMQISGITLILNFFTTAYIRDYLISIFRVRYIEGDSSIIENILNILCSIVSSIFVYIALKIKGIESDLSLMCSILYFIFGYIIIQIESIKNRKTKEYGIINTKRENKEDIKKYFVLPLVYSLIWSVIVFVLYLLLKENLNSDKLNNLSITLLVVPHILALIISFIYSKHIFKLAVKACDIDRSSESPTGRLYYETYLKIFYIFYFITIILLRNNANNISTFSIEYVCATTFLLTMIPYKFIKWFMFDGFIPDGKDISLYANKDDKKFDWQIKSGRWKDKNGNYGTSTTSTTKVGGITFKKTTYKDQNGKETTVDSTSYDVTSKK